MMNFKIISVSILCLSIHILHAEVTLSTDPTVTISDTNTTTEQTVTTTENNVTTVPVTCNNPETDDKLNAELLNTLPAVNILNLSGRDCNGVAVTRFVIHTLPNETAGVLYLGDAETEVLVGTYLSSNETDAIRFDPNENFEGNATFTYCAIDENDAVDASPATVTLPVVAPVVNGVICEDQNTTEEHVVHNNDCGCKDYESSIPSLSKIGLFSMFVLSIFMGTFFMRKEL